VEWRERVFSGQVLVLVKGKVEATPTGESIFSLLSSEFYYLVNVEQEIGQARRQDGKDRSIKYSSHFLLPLFCRKEFNGAGKRKKEKVLLS